MIMMCCCCCCCIYMRKVGKYKSKLEAQGWEYEMQVSFLEIYNEQIKDLLRDTHTVNDDDIRRMCGPERFALVLGVAGEG